MKIALINVYFGELPWYFPYFLFSSGYNPKVDFIIFTDDNTENFEIPKNVKIEEYSIKKFNESASKILGIPIDISTPYKLVRVKYMKIGRASCRERVYITVVKGTGIHKINAITR